MSSPLMSGGPLLNLRCSAHVRHFLLLLVRVVDWVCDSVGKADLLSEHFDSKQSRETVDLPLTSLAIQLLVLPPLLSGRERSGVSC